ncbi:class I SAM-dependent RNA methyltransferase [Granulicella paludicola]|uniref:class I SAM-dependent RNA methyltransferase n=1 Tax=Granulicella paludicola TaxID=474951 RepID=UPI0021DFB02F|nr:RsmD family RNA methyltransferase [Granulicella paludicola]
MSEPVQYLTPRCPHFGSCGGCQYQDLSTEAQLSLKRESLAELLRSAGVNVLAEIQTHASEPYGYRNRIRLRVETMNGELQLGYNERGTTTFLPITTCPIAAPALWNTAQSLLAAANEDRDAAFWLAAASEVEFFCNHDATQLQLTLLCAPRTKSPQGSFIRALKTFRNHAPEGITLVGAGAIASDPRTGPTGRTLAEDGAAGLNYRVGDETYWITRGGFFQINRFLLEALVDLVCDDRKGALAWDLFSGVGLFSRVLARSFTQVTAVESHPGAIADLRNTFRKLGPAYTAVEATVLDYLRKANLQRERPELVVLDPPRAGAGVEACELLLRIAPSNIVYVSCDPTTLARDLAVLQNSYTIDALHLMDLFPQTSHLETVAILSRTS